MQQDIVEAKVIKHLGKFICLLLWTGSKEKKGKNLFKMDES